MRKLPTPKLLCWCFAIRARAFLEDHRGVSAIEFALILPILLALFFGTVALSDAVSIYRKVTLTARSVSDLIARSTTITNADMTNILNAAASVASPYSVANLKVVVSSVSIDAQGTAKIAWSDTLNGTARAKNSTVTVPAGLNVPNRTLIWAEVEYTYTLPFGPKATLFFSDVQIDHLTLKDQIYMSPRLSDSISRVAS